MKKTNAKQFNKIYWVVSETSVKNAGYRVRSLPIAKEMKSLGFDVEFVQFSDFPNRLPNIATNALAVIVAKPADTTAHLCMRYLSESGVRVIVDLFDNYFSWSGQLHRRGIHWHWLRALQWASAISVSTPFLHSTVERLTDTPVTYVADPTPLPSYGRASKWSQRHELRLLWFGIPGNPYFPAGLDDLLSWAKPIAALQRFIFGRARVSLILCTNRTAHLEGVLAAFRNVGVSADFVQWTESVCNSLLDESHVVLLPTNTTGFSLSKTHNRCSDALARDCLVWASPSGPYRDVPNAVFFRAADLADAFMSQDEASIVELIGRGLQHICRAHPPKANARRLADAIRRSAPVRSTAAAKSGPKLLIVGQTAQSVVKLSRTMGYLTCNFAGSRTPWNFDIFLESIDVASASVTLKMTPSAQAALLELFDGDPDSRGMLAAVSDDMDVYLHSDLGTCTLTCDSLRPVLSRIEAMREIRLDHPMLYERWVELNVGLLSRFLSKLGCNNQDLAHDEAGAWEAHLEHSNRELARMGLILSELCHSDRGNEITWRNAASEGSIV
jgi:hypothetical protein